MSHLFELHKEALLARGCPVQLGEFPAHFSLVTKAKKINPQKKEAATQNTG